MNVLPQVFFIVLLAIAVWLFTKNILTIRKNILFGKPEYLSDNSSLRWKNVLLLALGQKKNV